MGTGKINEDKVRADNRLCGNKSGGPTPKKLHSPGGIERPELAQGNVGTEKNEGSDGADEKRPVHGAMKSKMPGAREIKKRPENHCTGKDGQKKENEGLSS